MNEKEQTKICSTCNQERLVSFFYKDSSKASGYKSSCKPCVLAKKKGVEIEVNSITSSEPSREVVEDIIEDVVEEVVEEVVEDESEEIFLSNENEPETHKTCRVCNETKEIEFMALKSGKPTTMCKTCDNERSKSYRDKRIAGQVNKQDIKMLSESLIGAVQMVSGMKKCTNCEEWRSVADFRKRTKAITGTSKKCRICIKKETLEKDHPSQEESELSKVIQSKINERTTRIMKLTLKNKGIIDETKH